MSNEINPEIMYKIHQISEYSNNRMSEYNNYGHQLDKLYNDIEAGKFGEDAKTGSWYGLKALKMQIQNLKI
jgi:hypothetical protein